MKIYAIHLLNDYSGSPKVLMQLVKGWVSRGLPVTVVTGTSRSGFLSNLPGVTYREYWYRWSPYPLVRLIHFAWSQLHVFGKLLYMLERDDVVYVNTVLPFGAALAGRIRQCRVIYHIHETSVKPILLKKFLFGVVHRTAQDVIYVSHFLASQEPCRRARTHVLYNAIENSFLDQARRHHRSHASPGNILMICSLKAYKGVNEFMALAKVHAGLQFKLVVNATRQELTAYTRGMTLPANLTISPVQKQVHSFYQWADVIVNLSRPDGWIETFGLTILEGMAHALPAIVPPVGGITELVEDGVNGYHADSRDLPALSAKLTMICDPANYHTLQARAAARIEQFREHAFLTRNMEILELSSLGIQLHNLETLSDQSL